MTNDFPVGYCTNVHAGIQLRQAKQNLIDIASPIRNQIDSQTPHGIGRLPVGLWLAVDAANELEQADACAQFREFLDQQQLKAYTLNGFPQGDFHQPIVKHAVYDPTWRDPARLEYTRSLANILSRLLDEGAHGSISTLPLGWPHTAWSEEDLGQAGQQLVQMADHLHQLHEGTGHEIALAIEPEPGCVLDTAEDIIHFLDRYVFPCGGLIARRHITVCHDVCHSAVMFESQRDVLNAYLRAGIRIGKVQVSSAMKVPWSQTHNQPLEMAKTITQLKRISEPRYLHQTTRLSADGRVEMVDDLPLALKQWLSPDGQLESSNDWHIHFHVPIYTDVFGQLKASRDDIRQVVEFLQTHRDAKVESWPWFTGDYEVETYAWGVLPPELQVADLAEGIARELVYLNRLLRTLTQTGQG